MQKESSTRYLTTKCIRFVLYAMNVVYLIIACLMIIGSTTLKAIFGEFYFTLWYSTLHSLPSLWIATGCFLIATAFFGIFATYKRSTLLLNLYALFLLLVFILQMSAAITGFALLPQVTNIVTDAINSLMSTYLYNYKYRFAMDFIQQTCCGNLQPSEWTYELMPQLPQSCCSYNNNYNFCTNYFNEGCHSPVRIIISRNILLIASSALIIGLFQIWGIINACLLATRERQHKTEREVQRWSETENITSLAELESKPSEGQLKSEVNYI